MLFDHFDHTALNAGSVKLIPAKKQPNSCTWDELFTDNIPPPRPDGVDAEDCFLLGETVVAASGDTCRVNSWVFLPLAVCASSRFFEAAAPVFHAHSSL
jgi:hypothetical protein